MFTQTYASVFKIVSPIDQTDSPPLRASLSRRKVLKYDRDDLSRFRDEFVIRENFEWCFLNFKIKTSVIYLIFKKRETEKGRKLNAELLN